jgi:hypothetical protein
MPKPITIIISKIVVITFLKPDLRGAAGTAEEDIQQFI